MQPSEDGEKSPSLTPYKDVTRAYITRQVSPSCPRVPRDVLAVFFFLYLWDSWDRRGGGGEKGEGRRVVMAQDRIDSGVGYSARGWAVQCLHFFLFFILYNADEDNSVILKSVIILRFVILHNDHSKTVTTLTKMQSKPCTKNCTYESDLALSI